MSPSRVDGMNFNPKKTKIEDIMKARLENNSSLLELNPLNHSIEDMSSKNKG